MFKFLVGIVLIMLNFNVEIGDISFGIIPSFLGYTVLYKGLRELEGESWYFQKIQKHAVVMAIFTGVMYVISIVTHLAEMSFSMSTVMILTLLETLIMIYIILNMVQGIQDIETSRGVDINGNKLMRWWKRYIVVFFATVVIFLLDSWMEHPLITSMISSVLLILLFVLQILFIVAMIKTYYLYKKVDYGKNI